MYTTADVFLPTGFTIELFFSVLTSEHVVAAARLQRRHCTNDRLGAASTLVAD